MTAPRVLFYVQHLLGIGHLARANRICLALAEDGFDVTVVTGGRSVPGFPGKGLGHVALPPVVAATTGFRGLADGDGAPVDDAYKARRTRLLLQTFADLRPDIVVTEAFPFGRRQMRFELLPLMAAVEAARPRPLMVSSIRDILQELVKPGRNAEAVALIKDHVDAVMVHGDPRFARLEDSFDLAAEVAEKVHYTGLVAPAPVTPSDEAYDVLVSAGGGAVGGALVRAAVDAAALVPDAGRWAIITGPNLPQPERTALEAQKPPHVTLFEFRQDFAALLAAAGLSVSQGGYNTVGDLLRAGCRAILVPFTGGGETEQAARARKLAALDRATVIDDEKLTPQTLAVAIEKERERGEPVGLELDLDGAAGSARLLRQLLERHRQSDR